MPIVVGALPALRGGEWTALLSVAGIRYGPASLRLTGRIRRPDF
jgi:hypothetical protein